MIIPFRDGEHSILMTVLMDRIGRHLTTGHRWRQSGDLVCIKIGGRWYVTREAWDRFLQKCNEPKQPTQAARLDSSEHSKTTKRREAELARDEALAAELGL
jgi:hypothetical protein